MSESRYKIRENHVVSIKNMNGVNNWFDTIMNSAPFNFESSKVSVLVKDGYLSIIPNEVLEEGEPSKIDYFKISIDNIECFGIEGEKYRENKITGGGSGGINYGGAIVGAVLAGAPGMIIGGQRQVEEVKSELITHDERVTYFNYFSDGVRKKITFLLDLHQYLMDTIPSKSYDIVYSKMKAELVDGKQANKTEKLQELQKMLSDGLISEIDYENAKNNILSQ